MKHQERRMLNTMIDKDNKNITEEIIKKSSILAKSDYDFVFFLAIINI